MNPQHHPVTPHWITKLAENEIFVFGSNLEGAHGGGAARQAHLSFGAEWGIGNGRTGQCYAIPTMHGGIEEIRPYVEEFVDYARRCPEKQFLLTRIGCGIAGFTDEEMAPLFLDCFKMDNVSLPREWLDIYGRFYAKNPRLYITPKVITEEHLKRLCIRYRDEIASGRKDNIPYFRIRYVEEQGKFGYAEFGDFFFTGEGGLYVWKQDDASAIDHSQGIAEEVLKNECKGRGYACRRIFAGIETCHKDSNSETIFTGDVLRLTDENGNPEDVLSVGSYEYSDNEGVYCFFLDNHFWDLPSCLRDGHKFTRIGTVFYQLDPNDEPEPLNGKTHSFNLRRDDIYVQMAKYTPNFDKEPWQYACYEVIGIEEYNWRN